MPLRSGVTVEAEQESPRSQGIGRVAIQLSSGSTYILANSGDDAWLKNSSGAIYVLDGDVAELDRGIYRIGSTTLCTL